MDMPTIIFLEIIFILLFFNDILIAADFGFQQYKYNTAMSYHFFAHYDKNCQKQLKETISG